VRVGEAAALGGAVEEDEAEREGAEAEAAEERDGETEKEQRRIDVERVGRGREDHPDRAGPAEDGEGDQASDADAFGHTALPGVRIGVRAALYGMRLASCAWPVRGCGVVWGRRRSAYGREGRSGAGSRLGWGAACARRSGDGHPQGPGGSRG